jgi:Flp pilus assembly protein TadD
LLGGCAQAAASSYQTATGLHLSQAKTEATRAVIDAESAVAEHPRSQAAWEALAWAFEAARDGQGAWQAMQRACRLKPKDGSCQDELGALALREGRLGEAVAAFQRATRLNGADWVAWDGLAQAQVAQRQFAAARLAVVNALAVGGPQAVTDWVAGELALAEHRLEVARAYFVNAQAEAPRWWAPYWGLASVDDQLGQAQKAREEVMTALKLNPASSQAWFFLQPSASAPGEATRPAPSVGDGR